MAQSAPLTPLQRAQQLLTEKYGTKLQLNAIGQLDSPKFVMRCAVVSNNVSLPDTVVLKQFQTHDSHGPVDSDRERRLFHNEQVSLDFIATHASGEALAPVVLARDDEQALLVLSDLGDVATLQDVLQKSSRATAAGALSAYGSYLGNLHAATLGRARHYRQALLEHGTATVVSDGSLDLRGYVDALSEMCAALGVYTPPDFSLAVADNQIAIHEAGPFLALCHTDAGPHNVLMTAQGPCLLDFEFAAFRNAFVDVAVVRLGFPPAFYGQPIPLPYVAAFEQAYRDALVQAVPAAAHDALFDTALSEAAAFWALSKLLGLWRIYLRDRLRVGPSFDESHPRTDGLRVRARVAAHTRAAAKTLDVLGSQPVIRDSLYRIYDALQQHFDDIEPLPVYPAFDDSAQLIAQLGSTTQELTMPASTKRSVAIMVFDDVEVLDFAGPFEVFSITNELNDDALFDVMTVSPKRKNVRAKNGLHVKADHTVRTAPIPDILVVPGGSGTRALLEDAKTMAWIKRVALDAELVLSVCTGSLVLASASLLEELMATTHHENLKSLEQISPTTDVRGDLRYIDNGQVITSGGISAGIDMSLHVIERLHGEAIVRKTAEYMEYGEWWPQHEGLVAGEGT